MKQILDVATMAIGIDATRGDRITVQNLSFVALPDEIEFHPTWDRAFSGSCKIGPLR